MNTPEKKEYHEHDTPKRGEYPDSSAVVSATECTGLMYKTPLDGEEWESYQELSPMGIPKGREELEDPVQEKLHRAKTAGETGRAVEKASGEYSPRHMKE